MIKMENKKNWRSEWRKDKTSKKYKIYLERRNKSMKEASHRRLDQLNKETHEKYKKRGNK